LLKKHLRFGRGFRVIPGNRGSGNRHRGDEVRNSGRSLLRTLNFHSPPAYRQDGEPLPRARK
jgi:hypothetical protein